MRAAGGKHRLIFRSLLGDCATTSTIFPSLMIIARIATLTISVIVPVFIPVFIPAISVMPLVTRGIFALVPAVLYKINSLVAGIVFTAMSAPVFGMPGRYIQIEWRPPSRYSIHCSRLLIDKLRRGRIVAKIEPAVKAWLADAHRYPHIGRLGR